MKSIRSLFCLLLCIVLCAGFVIPAAAVVYNISFFYKGEPCVTTAMDRYNNAVVRSLQVTSTYFDGPKTHQVEGYSIIGSDDDFVITNTGLDCVAMTPLFSLFRKTGDAQYEQLDGSAMWKDTVTGEQIVLGEGESTTVPVQEILDFFEPTMKKSEQYLLAVMLIGIDGKDDEQSWDNITLYLVDDTAAKDIINYPFEDVSYHSYCREAVLWALDNGVTTGTSETTFSPDGTCTRGQVATFLWRSLGCPEPETTENPFTDISESDYYYKPILWAYENGVTTGTSETTFSPNGTCTSAQVVTFLWRANGKPAATATGTEYYAEAVAWAEQKGLLEGVGQAFSPDRNSPRADIVTYLYRNANGK